MIIELEKWLKNRLFLIKQKDPKNKTKTRNWSFVSSVLKNYIKVYSFVIYLFIYFSVLPSQHDNLPVPISFIHLGGDWGGTMWVKSLAQGLNTVSSSRDYPQPCDHESNALTSAPQCPTTIKQTRLCRSSVPPQQKITFMESGLNAKGIEMGTGDGHYGREP